MMNKNPFPTITFDGNTYKLKHRNIEAPDLENMERFSALIWLNRNTWPRGYQNPSNPLSGMGGAVTLKR